MKNKNINIELLRVVAMLMIITLHYFNQGKVLSLTDPQIGWVYYLVWIVEGVCHISVNLYMFISGYFLSTKVFTWRRFVSLYATVLFYVLIISTIFFAAGIVPFSVKSLLSVLPIVSRSNWFVTVYFVVLLMMPLLNMIANRLDRAVFKRMLILFFILFSVIPTLFFWVDQFNLSDGYSILWYCYIYLLAAYIRKYGIEIKPIISVVMVLSILILPLTKFAIEIFFPTTILGSAKNAFYSYNAFPVFFASLAIFLFVVNRKEREERRWYDSIILFLGKTSFGVFYIHSFVILRDKLWILLGSNNYIGTYYQFVNMVMCVCGVYLACSLIDGLRILLFKYLCVDSLIKRISAKLDSCFVIEKE